MFRKIPSLRQIFIQHTRGTVHMPIPGVRDTMSDDMQQRGERDRARVNVHEEHEVRYWTDALHCSREQLIDAVNAVGTSAEAVRLRLTGRK